MVIAVAVADLHRHAAVERVGDAFGRRAVFERLCTGHIDEVSGQGVSAMAAIMSEQSSPVMTLPYFLKAASETF